MFNLYEYIYFFINITFQINMFLSRLTGSPIGLTALNMFVVDKPTMLTVSYLNIESIH